MQKTNNNTNVAIIGIGCMFPDSENSNKYWTLIKDREDAVKEIPSTHWKLSDYFDENQKAPDMTYAQTGGFLKPIDFDPMEYGIPPNSLEAIDSSQLLALAVAKMTLKDSGYLDKSFNREKTGVILGVTGAQELVVPLGSRLGHPIWEKAVKEAGGDDKLAEEVARRIAHEYPEWQEQSFPGLLGNVISGRISNFFDLCGTNIVADAACGSSLGALNIAYLELASGRADMMLTGGADTFNDIFMYMCFSKTPAMSPTGKARPFSEDGNGTVLGEGVGMILLKRLEDAEKDGDKIYAVIKGVGSGSDGKGAAVFAPQSKGQIRAIKQAHETSDIAPATIGLMEAHGTGTKVGDGIELSSIKTVYTDVESRNCALGSVKSQIGHCKASAGIAGIIKSVLALYYKVLPPTIHGQSPLAALNETNFPFYLNTEPRPWCSNSSYPRRGSVSAFGFGGTNFHCIIEEYGKDKKEIDWNEKIQILAISANSKDELIDAKRKLEDMGIEDLISYAQKSRDCFEVAKEYRLVAVIKENGFDKIKFISGIKSAIEKEISRPLSEGIFFGKAKFAGKISFIFPGQGAQYVGMLRDLACTFPQMLSSIEDMNSAYGNNIADIIYPKNTVTTQKELEEELTKTQNAQPSLGAVSLGGAKVLDYFGVTPDFTAGHSYGELTALCAGGKLDTRNFCELSVLRGRLMGEGDGDRGTMCAVMSDSTTIDTLLKDNKIDVIIANKNAPKQTVLSGRRDEISKAIKMFMDNGITAKELQVAAAFHSPLVSSAEVPFAEKMKSVIFNDSKINVFSNTTAKVYPENSTESGELLAHQLAKPVLFTDEISQMYAQGSSLFIEIGPGARMTNLIKNILTDKDGWQALALDSSQGKNHGLLDLAVLLSALSAMGIPVLLSKWAPCENKENKKKFTVKICGANYKMTRKPIAPSSDKYVIQGNTPEVYAQPKETQIDSGLAVAISAIQNMQVQTSILHKQFMDNQHKTLMALSQMTGALLPEEIQQVTGNIDIGNTNIPTMKSVEIPKQLPTPQKVVKENVVFEAVREPKNFTAEITAIIAEKTGYPTEMLEPAMDLESDLGIDSIKKVEIFSALRDKLPQMPAMSSEDMSSVRTIENINNFIQSNATTGAVSHENIAPISEAIQSTYTASENFTAEITAIIAEKTGYPTEMLEPAMDLESDLGIDSIKKVEIFSALRDKLPQMPAMSSEDMSSVRTIENINKFIQSNANTGAVSHENIAPAVQAIAKASNHSENLIAEITAVIADKTGYPTEMLEPAMDLESDLGIDSIKKVEIFSELRDKLPQMPAMSSEDMSSVRTIENINKFIQSNATIGAVSHENIAPAAQAIPKVSNHSENLIAEITAVIAEKTGYPTEMLEPAMDLESDLGIDSIKKVEIFSELRDKLPQMPAMSSEDMSSVRTIENINKFITGGISPDTTNSDMEQSKTTINDKAQETVPPMEQIDKTQLTQPSEIEKQTLDNVSLETDGVYEEPIALERSILKLVPVQKNRQRLENIKNLCLLGEDNKTNQNLANELKTYGVTAQILNLDEYKSAETEKMDGLVIVSGTKMPEADYLEKVFRAVKFIIPEIAKRKSIFVTISFNGGSFGVEDMKIAEPLYGGLSGFAKTVGIEYPGISCKAIDFDLFLSDSREYLRALSEEILTDDIKEVAISRDGTNKLELVREKQKDGNVWDLTASDVVLVTGGGRGVTANCIVTMAQKAPQKPFFVLLGRTPLAKEEEEWLKSLTDEAEIKRALMRRMDKPTPIQLTAKYNEIMAQREIRETLNKLRSISSNVRTKTDGGGVLTKINTLNVKAEYIQADIRDSEAVKKVIQKIKTDFGKIKGFIHGAGVLADKKLEDKTEEEFNSVCNTKITGMNNILSALKDDILKFIAFFSSSTGRFGRKGQIDYSVANEVLNKTARLQKALRPDCKVVSFNWGPWDGGMVNENLKKLFASEGIGCIPMSDGADFMFKELCDPTDENVEITVLAALPSVFNVVYEREISLNDTKILKDHVIAGKAVVPLALTVEFLAHGAMLNHPGEIFYGFDNLRVIRGIKLSEEDTIRYRVLTGKETTIGELTYIPVRLESKKDSANFNSAKYILNASAEIILSKSKMEFKEKQINKPKLSKYEFHGNLYNDKLFHGKELQGILSVEGYSHEGISCIAQKSPKPPVWIKNPLRSYWIAEPTLIDCAFQEMILWTSETLKKPSLPSFVASYRQNANIRAEKALITALVTSSNESSARADIEFKDQSGNLFAVMRGYECTADASLNAAFKANLLSEAKQTVTV